MIGPRGWVEPVTVSVDARNFAFEILRWVELNSLRGNVAQDGVLVGLLVGYEAGRRDGRREAAAAAETKELI